MPISLIVHILTFSNLQIIDQSDQQPNDSVNITFSHDNSNLPDSQIQNSSFKNEKVKAFNLQISKLPLGSDEKIVSEKTNSPKAKIETDRTKYVKIDDSYSFTYTMSRNEIKSKSDFSGMSPRSNIKSPMKKSQKRILMDSNQKKYKPRYLVSKKFGKKDGSSERKYKKRKTCTLADKMEKMHHDSVQLRKNKQIRKSANSRMMRPKIKKKFYNTASNNYYMNKTERAYKKPNFDLENDLMKVSRDSFVKKSINRLFNLEDLQTVIKKTKKHIKKSTSRLIFS